MKWKMIEKKVIEGDNIKLEYHLIPKNIIRRLIWKLGMPYLIYLHNFVFDDKQKALKHMKLRGEI